jgi:hypothetical protein
MYCLHFVTFFVHRKSCHFAKKFHLKYLGKIRNCLSVIDITKFPLCLHFSLGKTMTNNQNYIRAIPVSKILTGLQYSVIIFLTLIFFNFRTCFVKENCHI